MQKNVIFLIAYAAFLSGLLGFAYGSFFNSGCKGFENVGAIGGCAEFVLYRYQALIGIGGAITAAMIAARPVWQQLSEMSRQSDGQTLEYLRRRSVELDREQSRIYEITSSIDIAAKALVQLANTRENGLLFAPHNVFKNAETYMNSMIHKFDAESGPLWGGKNIHAARAQVKDDAQRFSVELTKFSPTVIPYAPVTDAEFDAIARQLAPFRDSVFAAANIVHSGIVAERDRVGARISTLEAKL
jgi:hypothetical protein